MSLLAGTLLLIAAYLENILLGTAGLCVFIAMAVSSNTLPASLQSDTSTNASTVARRAASQQSGGRRKARRHARRTRDHPADRQCRKTRHVCDANMNKPEDLLSTQQTKGLQPVASLPECTISHALANAESVDARRCGNTAPHADTPHCLRKVIVPMMAIGKFLSLAQPNTECKIETCGVLAGEMSLGQFRITHVLIPKQTATSDSCTTFEEEDILNCHEQNNLITLGWIHTHPTQRSFLSSVDLHTQASYQRMLPEAVAIVCAPRYTIGYFTLTEYGRQFLGNCKKTGFHHHPKTPPLFCAAPHLEMDERAEVTIHDMR